MTGTNRLIQNHSHWGAFLAEVEDGRVVGVRPFERDPDPSPLIEAIPAAVHSPTRIAQPMVREGWLKHGPGSGEGRGREPFVPVSWERALDLVAGELARVQARSWPRRHHGRLAGLGARPASSTRRAAQLRRFLAAFGGFVDQASNYSFGTALTFLPHILGSAQAVTGPLTSWSSIARHAQADGAVRRRQSEEHAGDQGRLRRRTAIGGWIAELGRAGVEVVNISPIREDGPEAVAPEWIPIRPNTDTAMLLALAHTLVVEGLHDEEFLARYCVGFERVLPYLHGRERRPAEGCRLGGGDHRRSGRDDPRAGAPHGGDAHHGHRVVVAAARRSRRAAVLGGGAAGVVPRPDRLAGRRLRLRLWLGAPASPSRRSRSARRRWRRSRNPLNRRHSGGAHRRLPAASRRALTTSTASSGTYPDIRLVYWAGGNPFHHHQDINQLRRAWRRPETIVVHEPWWTATARHADIVLPATTSLERNDIGGAPRDRFVIAMQQAIEPVGEARNDFDIFAELAQRLGCADAYTQGPRRDGAGCGTSTTAGATSVRTNAGGDSRLRHVLGGRLSGDPAARRRIRACSPISAPIPSSNKLGDAVGPDRALFREDRGLRL